MKKKIYIGFSVDMDRANSLYNNHGNLILELDNYYITNKYYYENFIEETKKLVNYFNKNGYEESVTWFVNESDYNITVHHKNILSECLKYGKIGLHTHFNSVRFNADLDYMSNNPYDWLEQGLELPTKRLEEFTNKNILSFKAGNHMRNDAMFEMIAKNNFVIDCTKVIADITIYNENGKILSDDRDLILGSEPFFIKTSNKHILEIPELRVENVKLHILKCIEENKLPLIKLQIHHWQYNELIPKFDNLINELKKDYDLNFISLEEMLKIFFNKIMSKENEFMLNFIKSNLHNDTYYLSLKNIYDNNILDIVVYIFKNFKNDSKIIELFSGIGQTSYLLSKFGFNSLHILDFDKSRLNYFKEITSIYEDFFKSDLSNYDCVFMTNSINSVLCLELDKQIEIYNEFLSKKANNTLIINYLKYGDYSRDHSNKIIEYFQNKFDIKYLNDEYVIIKNIINNNKSEPFSKIFKSYKLINPINTKNKLINIDNQDIINIFFSSNFNLSFGIYFPIYDYKSGLTKVENGKLEFECCSDKEIKIKIYTGEKWIKLSNIISQNYQKILLIDNFLFNTKSTYRIGFYDILENTNVFLKNIIFSER